MTHVESDVATLTKAVDEGSKVDVSVSMVVEESAMVMIETSSSMSLKKSQVLREKKQKMKKRFLFIKERF